MWQELKKLAGWKLGERLPDTVLDEEGEEVEAKEALGTWRKTFENLGREDPEDESFSREQAERY